MAPFADYTPDNNPDLLNPERGMYSSDLGKPNFGVDTPTQKANYHTIFPAWLWLAPWCNKELVWNGYLGDQTSPVLNEYAKTLEDARSGGYKILFRPRYDKHNDPNDPDPQGHGPSDCKFEGGTAQVFHADSRGCQKDHITAIANMLGDYKDVIAYIQAGYLGKYGEWHTAGNDEQDNPIYTEANAPLLYNIAFRTEIIDWVLHEYGRVGIKQHVEFRRPVFAREVLMRKEDARVGFHNDCFMSTVEEATGFKYDYGTYENFDAAGANAANFASPDKAYDWAAETLTPTASFGGETCPAGGNERWRFCNNMIGNDMTGETSEPASLHMNYLNHDYAGAEDGFLSAVDEWQKGCCYDEIRLRLGYRFGVTCVEYPETVPASATFSVAVDVVNTGWAKLHKPRIAMLVLRLVAPPDDDKKVYVLDDGKVETWEPGWEQGDEPNRLSITDQEAPSTPGKYSVRLWIPDPDLEKNDPDKILKEEGPPLPIATITYAVKLATLRDDGTNVFDQTTGENDLGVEIEVQ